MQQAIDNMRGGSAHNYNGTQREPGDYTDLEANLAELSSNYEVGSKDWHFIAEFWINHAPEYINRGTGFIITGPTGCGKLHLSKAILDKCNKPYLIIKADDLGTDIDKMILSIVNDNPDINYLIDIQYENLIMCSDTIKVLLERGLVGYVSSMDTINFDFTGSLVICTNVEIGDTAWTAITSRGYLIDLNKNNG